MLTFLNNLAHNLGMGKLLFLGLLFCLNAEAVQVSRITEFEDNTRIRADQMNAELDNIISAINDNDGSVYNRRVGCVLTGNHSGSGGVKGFDVLLPCDLIIDGEHASLSASQNISVLNNIDTGSPGQATWHAVYARVSSGNIIFHTSLTAPDLTNGKKTGDTTARYIGAVKTAAATTDVVFFRTNPLGNEYTLYSVSPVSYTHHTNTLTTTTTADYITDGPVWGKESIFQVKAVGSATGICEGTFYLGLNNHFPVFSTVTGTYPAMKQPYFSRALIDFSYSSSNNCNGITLKEIGFADHAYLYR